MYRVICKIPNNHVGNRKLQSEYKRLKAEGKKEAAQEYWDTHLSDKALRGKDQQLDAMQKLWELITNPALMRRQNPNHFLNDIYDLILLNIYYHNLDCSFCIPFFKKILFLKSFVTKL